MQVHWFNLCNFFLYFRHPGIWSRQGSAYLKALAEQMMNKQQKMKVKIENSFFIIKLVRIYLEQSLYIPEFSLVQKKQFQFDAL